MPTHFYSHLTDPQRFHAHLQSVEMTDDERTHLVVIIESTLHHRIIDIVLENMPDPHKDTFLDHVASEDHEAVWRLLNEHVEKSEETIKEVIHLLEKELEEDLNGIL